MQDLVLGSGKVTQVRNGTEMELDAINVPLIFPTVEDYKASTEMLPTGQTVHLNDRAADFRIIAGTSTADGFGVIANNNISQSAEYADPVATAKG
ncbi:MAG: hypothetical protein GY914_06965, partial [Prochlorococcus sp.]|nr:hypothetical protein [Prochlorococcus sp.]